MMGTFTTTIPMGYNCTSMYVPMMMTGGSSSVTLTAPPGITSGTMISTACGGIVTLEHLPYIEPLQAEYNEFTTRSDFIITSKGTKFHIERDILSRFSSVFKEMFTLDSESKELDLSDWDPGAILEFLRFIYTPKWCTYFLGKEHIVELAKFSHRYDIMSLLEKCEQVISTDHSILLSTKITLADTLRLRDLQETVYGELMQNTQLTEDNKKALLACRKEFLLGFTEYLLTRV